MKFFWIACCLLGIALPASAQDVRLEVQGGVIQRQEGSEITIWANSPQTSYSIDNQGREFFHAKVQWRNVPAGSFLVTPQGVADALARTGGTISSSVSVPAGSRSAWQLNSNIKGDYRFVVVAGPTTPALLKRINALDKKPNFAIHLGDGAKDGYYQFLNRLSNLSFPTYLLPGRKDRSGNFVRLCGKSKQIFDVMGDRFLFLDNRTGKLGKSQLHWADEVLAGSHRNTFVFSYLPLKPTRTYRGDAREVKRLVSLFKQRKVTTMFSGAPSAYSRKKWGALEMLSVGERAVLVDCSQRGISIRPF